VPGVSSAVRPVQPIITLAAATLLAAMAGCGSGDSTVAKTPQPTGPAVSSSGAAEPSGPAPSTSPPPPDPCAINLAAPAIAKAVSELPRDPRSKQPWNPEPLAGNYNVCAELSAVIVQANTNAENPSTRAVLFHLGRYIPQSVPDTYGFDGIDPAQCTADTVALQHPIGVRGAPSLKGTVKFHWNGTGVEIIANAAG
jgi:hypothetical protein